MNDKTYSTKIETIKNSDRIHTLVEKLRQKLKNFVVLDGGGLYVGNVKDLTLDKHRQLNFIVSQPHADRERLCLLMSRLVQKIDPPSKSVIVGIRKVEIDRLPEYVMTENRGMESQPLTRIADTDRQTAGDTIEASHRYPANIVEPTAVMPTHSSEAAQAKTNDASETLLSPTSEVLEEEIIRLLEERLVVDRSKHKVGEVIVRKEIETQMIQVPVDERN
jgi:hypothetical protein